MGELIANPVNGEGGGDSGDDGTDDAVELWDIANKKRKSGTYYYTASNRRVIEPDVYVYGAKAYGYWISNQGGTLVVNNNDFSLTSTSATGLSVPVELKKGVEYNLSITADGKFDTYLSMYQSDGVYRANVPLLKNTEAGTHTAKIVPSESAYYMLVIDKVATETEQTVTFTNISLTRADANTGV